MPMAGLVNQGWRYAPFPDPYYPSPAARNIVYDHTFINFFRFLSGTCAPMGVRLRAYHTGSGVPNGGMNPMDAGYKIHGDHAWYTFEFTQANPPFWLHAWCGFFSNFDTGGVAAPALSDGGNSGNNRHWSIAVACRSDGGCPWNGSTSSSGIDTKGTPVWSATAGGGSGTLYVWPRSNNPGGAHNTNKENCAGAFSDNTESTFVYDNSFEPTSFAHFFAGPDWYLLLNDAAGSGICYWDHFGKYIPIPQLSGTCPHYFMANFKGRMSNGHGTYDQFMHEVAGFQGFGSLNGGSFDASTFGSFAGSDFAVDGLGTGGIAVNPSASSSPVRVMHWSMPSIFPYTIHGMTAGNLATTSGSAWIDEWTPYLYVGENTYGTGAAGYIGVARDLKIVGGGIQHYSLNAQRTKAAFHCFPYLYGNVLDGFSGYNDFNPVHISLVTPWTSSIYPYHDVTYDGTPFYIP